MTGKHNSDPVVQRSRIAPDRTGSGTTRFHGQAFAPALILLCSLLLVACGRSGQDPAAQATDQPDSQSTVAGEDLKPGDGHSGSTRSPKSPVAPSDPEPEESPKPESEDSDPWLIDWVVSLGPSAPGGNHSVPLDAFKSLVAGDCARTAEVGKFADEPQNRLLYVGVGNACLAAFHGQPSRWPVAQSSFADLQGHRELTGCYGKTAYDLLEALVNAHGTHPERRFERVASSPSSGECVRVLSVVPNAGSMSGGYLVTLHGRNFPAAGRLTILGANIMKAPPVVPYRSTDQRTRIEFRMPAAEAPRRATIVVDGSDAYWNSGVAFRFRSDPGPSPSTSPSPPPAAPSSPSG